MKWMNTAKKWYALFDGLEFIEFRHCAIIPWHSHVGPFETLVEAKKAALARCAADQEIIRQVKQSIHDTYRRIKEVKKS